MDLMSLKSNGRALRRRLYQPSYRGYGPMPLLSKQSALKHVFMPGAVVIETGTYHGDSTRFFAGAGFAVHTIEVSETLARQVFPGLRRIGVTCHRGDSAKILPELLMTLADEGVEDLNFWLDGHWSGGVTSTAPTHETPITAELEAIAALRSRFRRMVIAVDDLRCFGNDAAYPDKYFLIDWARRAGLQSFFLADIFVASTETHPDI
jgi:hypothetical protein